VVLLGFFNGNNFAALVEAALGAGAVGRLLLVAVRAIGQRRLAQEIMRPASAGALLRMTAFRIRHGSSRSSWLLEQP